MRARERCLVVVVAAACFGGLGCGEAVGQTTKLLEFGPDSMEVRPPAGAAKDTLRARPVELEMRDLRPWVLARASALRLPPPPGERESTRERLEMRKLSAGDDAAALDRVRYWDAGSPEQRWREMLADMEVRGELPHAAASHARALLEAAIHDSRIAAWDSKRAYWRRPPSDMDARLVPEVVLSGDPSYPCEYAVVAAAAAAVLGYLFPADAYRLAAAAHEAAWSRVVASAVYPSDAEGGLALGRAVAARVIDEASGHPDDGAGKILVTIRASRSTASFGIGAIGWQAGDLGDDGGQSPPDVGAQATVRQHTPAPEKREGRESPATNDRR